MSSGTVAVIDIGSNSIKILVAQRAADGRIATRHLRTVDARISAGISRANPRLSDEGMDRGLDAIRSLLQDATAFNAGPTVLVATSAVRDAQNGRDFRERVRAATGCEIRLLSGDEEANLIGRGLTADPALRALQDFYVFDLGGGSLECLAFRRRRIEQSLSLRLGSVRMMEQFVPDPAAPFPAAAQFAITRHAQATLEQSGFRFTLPESTVAIGSGGSVTTVRAISGARRGKPFEETSAHLTIAELREMLAWLGALPLAERRRVPGLPPGRADIFPTALATLIALAELGRFSAYENSVYNLRYGIADELLGNDRGTERAP